MYMYFQNIQSSSLSCGIIVFQKVKNLPVETLCCIIQNVGKTPPLLLSPTTLDSSHQFSVRTLIQTVTFNP